jgi:hypothetical protein
LSRDLEAVARTLNGRIRRAFERTRGEIETPASTTATRQDILLPPPMSMRSRTITAGGLTYRFKYEPIATPDFYDAQFSGKSIIVSVNTDHPFFTEMYRRAASPSGCGVKYVEGLVLAAARAELEAKNDLERQHVARLRRAWSDALAAFLRP